MAPMIKHPHGGPLKHPRLVMKALYYGMRWRLKRLLGIKDAPNVNVLASGVHKATERHGRICRTLLAHLPDPSALRGANVAEIGCGDCLAAADMMLGLGASRVFLVDRQPIVISPLHREVLRPLAEDPTLPNRAEILSPGDEPSLDPAKASAHHGLLEEVGIPAPVSMVYSFDVVEHVEDLDGFFSCCYRMLTPGGISLHKFDLSGHEFFEDPLPPLDFQTYPTWLFNLIFPKYRRAAGHFADTILESMKRQGFQIESVIPIRTAEEGYLSEIWQSLRKEARLRDPETVGLLDVIVVARKPSA